MMQRTKPSRRVAVASAPEPVTGRRSIRRGVEHEIQPIVTRVETFRPMSPPSVIPAAARAVDMAMDDGFATAYQWASQSAWHEGLGFLGYPYLAELTQRPEYRRGSEIIAQEMTRKWIKITSTTDSSDESGDPDKARQAKADKVKALDEALTKFKVQAHFRRAIELDGFFGRSHIYLDTGVSDDRDLLKTPLILSPKTHKKGTLVGLKVIEPVWTYPNAYNSNDPTDDNYYRPQTWWVQGKEIHRSRVLAIVGREMPDLLKPAYSFGGLSLTQMAKPYVDNWLRTRQSVSDLLHSFSKTILKTNMEVLLEGGGPETLLTRLDVFNRTRDNRGVMAIDFNAEDVVDVSTPLGTLDALQSQAQEQICSVLGIPLVVFLGVTPSGLNASSDGEVRTFYAWIKSQQEKNIRPSLQSVFELVQLDTFGEIDPGLGFQFLDLWEQDEGELATNRKTDADTAVALIGAGVLDPEEERERLAADENSPYHGIKASDVPEPPEPEDTGDVPHDGEGEGAPEGGYGKAA